MKQLNVKINVLLLKENITPDALKIKFTTAYFIHQIGKNNQINDSFNTNFITIM